MVKFFGEVGYGVTEETKPGIHKQVITEYPYYGDVLQNARNLSTGEYLNDDLSVENSISIVADAYANEHYFAIRYVKWQGVRWTVAKVTVASPRLVLRLGKVYDGPTPNPSPS